MKQKRTRKNGNSGKSLKELGLPYIEGNTKYVPTYVKGKIQYIAMAHFPMKEGDYNKLEAVKQGVFTAYEMIGFIECFNDNMVLVFHVLDRPGASSEQIIKELISFKNHYTERWDKLSHNDKPQYIHQHHKLMNFLDERLWNEQQKFILKEITPAKTAKENKDLLLNQEQLALLFLYLQKINVFDINQKLNTKISLAINMLTGWDSEKIRQLLSIHTSFEYSQNPKVKKAVQKLLEELNKIN